MRPEGAPRAAPFRRLVPAGCLGVSLGILATCAGDGPTPEEMGHLDVRTELEGRSLAHGAVHRYGVELEAGWALRLEVGRGELDVELRLEEGRGSRRITVDMPVGRQAVEKLCFVAPEAGAYSVDVAPFAGSGRYSLRVSSLGPATPRDAACAEALELFRRAWSGDLAEEESPAGVYAASAGLFDRAGETFLAAVAWRESASADFARGDPERAIRGYRRALVLARRAGSAYLEVSVLNRLGLAQSDYGDLERALGAFEEARRRSRESDDRRGLASALTNLGSLAPDLGDPHTALDHLRAALEIWRSLDDLDEQAQTLIHLATALGTLDRHREAADALERAVDLASRAGDDARLAGALAAAGWNHYLQGAYAQALEPLGEALEIYRGLGWRNAEAGVLDRRGAVLAAAGDAEAAIESFRRVLELLGDRPNPRDLAAASIGLGCLLAEDGDLDEAARHLEASAAFYGASGDPKAAAQNLFCQAKVARRRGALGLALRRVEEALAIVDQLRGRARELGHSYLPIWLWRDYADLAIDLRLERHAERGDEADLAAAFETLDRARAWGLFEQVVERRRRETAPPEVDPPEASRALQARLNLLAESRRRLRERGAGEPGLGGRGAGERGAGERDAGERLAEIEAEMRRLALELEDARAERRAAERRAGRLGSPRPVSLARLQARLPAGSRLLAYRLGEARTDLFAVDRETIEVWPLASSEVLERHTEAFYRALGASRLAKRQWRLLAETLGRLLLPEGAVPEGVDRLYVMADGLLHYVPFAILASPCRGHRLGPESHLLIDDVALSYLPSASVFLALDERRGSQRPPDRTLAVFADPVFALDDERLTLDGAGAGEPLSNTRGIPIARLPAGPLLRLPHSAAEAEAVLALVEPSQGAAWVGFEATKRAVLEGDLGRFRILHFATHAWIDERLPELSGLVLSRYGRDGEPLDGDLHLHEVQDLSLAAELTILSGCQTALGRHVRGNGLLGLTHGFFDAGSARVLVSLWSVDDRSASLLMPVVVRHLLASGREPAAALREAQRWLRRQPGFEAPYYWGPFAVHGAP